MKEKDIQISLIKYLNLKRNVLAFSVPNERKVSVQTGRLLNRMGRVSGVPDLLIIKSGGQYLHLEVKTEKGKLSANQETILNKLQHMNCNAQVGYGLDHCIKIIDKFLN